jgi:hypothetical protein
VSFTILCVVPGCGSALALPVSVRDLDLGLFSLWTNGVGLRDWVMSSACLLLY